MRTTFFTLVRARLHVLKPGHRPTGFGFRTIFCSPCRSLAHVSSRDIFPEIGFLSSSPSRHMPERLRAESDHVPPDERTLKLGKTLRMLQSRLPTLLASPLPPEILSPHITLHLFPSSHPHLPTVSGRVAYHAALWTAPMAWGRVPIVGNVKLIILSERLVKSGPSYHHMAHTPVNSERLIVRWRTCGKTHGKGMDALYRGIGAHEQVDKITEFLGGDARDDEEFGGKFIFEFDEEGRIITHTIEHAEDNGDLEKTSKVVTVTDWLLGRPWKKRAPELAWSCVADEERDERRRRIGAREE